MLLSELTCKLRGKLHECELVFEPELYFKRTTNLGFNMECRKKVKLSLRASIVECIKAAKS